MAFDAAAALGLAAGVFLAISAHVLFLTDFLMAVLGVLAATVFLGVFVGVFALAAKERKKMLINSYPDLSTVAIR
jgi:hypothetical protein